MRRVRHFMRGVDCTIHGRHYLTNQSICISSAVHYIFSQLLVTCHTAADIIRDGFKTWSGTVWGCSSVGLQCNIIHYCTAISINHEHKTMIKMHNTRDSIMHRMCWLHRRHGLVLVPTTIDELRTLQRVEQLSFLPAEAYTKPLSIITKMILNRSHALQ